MLTSSTRVSWQIVAAAPHLFTNAQIAAADMELGLINDELRRQYVEMSDRNAELARKIERAEARVAKLTAEIDALICLKWPLTAQIKRVLKL